MLHRYGPRAGLSLEQELTFLLYFEVLCFQVFPIISHCLIFTALKTIIVAVLRSSLKTFSRFDALCGELNVNVNVNLSEKAVSI